MKFQDCKCKNFVLNKFQDCKCKIKKFIKKKKVFYLITR